MSCIIFCIVKQKYRLLATFGSFSRVVNQRCSLESSNPERFVISHLGKSSAGCCQRPAECYHWKPPMAFRNNLTYLDMELRTNIWWSGFFRTYVLNTDVVFVVLYCTVLFSSAQIQMLPSMPKDVGPVGHGSPAAPLRLWVRFLVGTNFRLWVKNPLACLMSKALWSLA